MIAPNFPDYFADSMPPDPNVSNPLALQERDPADFVVPCNMKHPDMIEDATQAALETTMRFYPLIRLGGFVVRTADN
jgi:hypothetical protein